MSVKRNDKFTKTSTEQVSLQGPKLWHNNHYNTSVNKTYFKPAITVSSCYVNALKLIAKLNVFTTKCTCKILKHTVNEIFPKCLQIRPGSFHLHIKFHVKLTFVYVKEHCRI